ncbi:NADH (or F420H2) dehydrogenase, subunit C [Paenibacillus curdlanolyticus YK9]|uniref:NADH-quinone oxidoreductase subunit C n=1 Tax=Paenibacillus curdlanolyticus YK9 TaxID=717606 RepID=E0IEI5_9BACL|nr:NADH-quinone oxidoreductase subunit C [Paenibacillus curdlanolyticus]EFM09073.1 NADH (or F420H2) dehydrogenase, subunit C [Paenibacillus curdlanolyticus YK9]
MNEDTPIEKPRRPRADASAVSAEADGPPAEPKPASPLQPLLDEAVALVREAIGEEAIEEAYVNELGSEAPTLVVRPEYLLRTAELFKEHASLSCRYLRNVSGVDYETHLEVVYHLVNLETGENYTIKSRADRQDPIVDSVTPVWETANWNEREIYDLLGVQFKGHPDMRRIMMPDDWVGYPLRKDYEPLDPEV